MPFLNKLEVEELENDRWRLVRNLKYQTRDCDLIVVPKGFKTDFASVPRLPLAFLIAGNTAHAPAVVHDYLYSKKIASKGEYSRADADRIFREAMDDEGMWWWRRWLLWTGVRVFGSPCFNGVK